MGFDRQGGATAAQSLSPEGRRDNSPRFQPWERATERNEVPKGRPRRHAVQPSLRDFHHSNLGYPTLKRWAIIKASLRDEDVRLQCSYNRPSPSSSHSGY